MAHKSVKKTPPSRAADSLGSARQRILDAAIPLFYQQGSRAVGIDTVIAESGVAKMSLYRSFRSKDDLIAACLEERNTRYWQWFDSVVAENEGNPREQLRALIHRMARRTTKPGYRGCPFLNTALDYEDAAHPARQLAVRHKRTLAAKLLAICRRQDARDPESLARQLVLLINGAQATAGMLGEATQLELIQAAEFLIDRQCTKPARRHKSSSN